MIYSKWSDLNVTATYKNNIVRVIKTNEKYHGMYWIVQSSDGSLYEKVKHEDLSKWNWENAKEQNQESEKRRRGRPRKNK